MKTTEGNGIKREIKFRLWDVDGEQWLREDQFMIYPNGTVKAWIEEDEVKNVELTQYTGLKDKNGKEIYEGDIFQCISGDGKKMMQGEIYFNESCFCMQYGYQKPMKDERKDYFLSSTIKNDGAEKIEIIGNIYENPELLINHPTHH